MAIYFPIYNVYAITVFCMVVNLLSDVQGTNETVEIAFTLLKHVGKCKTLKANILLFPYFNLRVSLPV